MKTGELCLQSWAGFRKTRVEIVGETPKRYRIRALKPTQLAGRYRSILPGQMALVPKRAVRDIRDA